MQNMCRLKLRRKFLVLRPLRSGNNLSEKLIKAKI